jgi:outer membrane lipoprotein SlyB
MKTLRIFIVPMMLLTACAEQRGWTPTVDPYGDPNAYRLNQDMAECQQLASHASGGTAKEAAIGVAGGGLLGAAGGAAIGAIAGNPAAGAMIGATAGGLTGGATQGYDSNANYKRAYNTCLRNRGHRPIN